MNGRTKELKIQKMKLKFAIRKVEFKDIMYDDKKKLKTYFVDLLT